MLDARDHPEMVEQLAAPEMVKRTERIFRIRIVSHDWNCPKHITPRHTAAEVAQLISPLRARITELESRLPAL